MKKTLIKTAMMAVIALTLLAGSAFADGISRTCGIEVFVDCVYFSGGDGELFVNNTNYTPANSINNANFVGLYSAPDGMKYSVGYGIFDFSEITPVPSLPQDSSGMFFQFRDIDNSSQPFDLAGTVLDFGTIGTFNFTVDKIDDFDLWTDGNGLTIYLSGWVYDLDEYYDPMRANWALDVAMNGGKTSWNASLDINVEPPSTVPEPGTLVLLGTGLLGAALVARRKMSK